MSRDEDRTVEKRTLLGRLWGGVKWVGSVPARGLPLEEISSGWRWIAETITGFRTKKPEDRRFRTYEDGSFDLQATAFLHGMTVWQVDSLLARRQRERAIAAYFFFAWGLLFLAIWLWMMATTPWSGWLIVPVLEFAPFCVFLFVIAFQNALANYQIRIRRLASPAEFLKAEAFWPR